jgi:hypothetical protein
MGAKISLMKRGAIPHSWPILAVISAFVAQACATGGARFEVKTTPEGAEVSVVRPGGAGVVSLGKSPLFLTPEQVPDVGGKMLTIQVRKDGYQTENIILPEGSVGGMALITFQLKEANVSTATGKASESAQNELAKGIAQIHRQVSRKNFDDAIRLLDNLLARHPRVATLYDLLGGIHYLRKDSSRALDAFKRSLELDPSNAETSRLVEKLRSFQGRIPSEGEQGEGG